MNLSVTEMNDSTNIFMDIKKHSEYIELLENHIALKKEYGLLTDKFTQLNVEFMKLKGLGITQDNYEYSYGFNNKSTIHDTNIKYTITEKTSNNDNILDDNQIKDIYTKYKIPFFDESNCENDDSDYNEDDSDESTESESSCNSEYCNEESNDIKVINIDESLYNQFENSEPKLIYHSEKVNDNEHDDINDNENYYENEDDENEDDENEDDENEDDENGCDDEVFEKIINDKKYYVTTGKNSKIYEIEDDETAGKCVGSIINNTVYFN